MIAYSYLKPFLMGVALCWYTQRRWTRLNRFQAFELKWMWGFKK